jgi:hypothetical protein
MPQQVIRSLVIQPLDPLKTHFAIAIARGCIRSGARSEHLDQRPNVTFRTHDMAAERCGTAALDRRHHLQSLATLY